MKRSINLHVILSFFLCACSTGVELTPVSKEPLLNDLNSKVWLVDQAIRNDTNYAPRVNIDKDILVFYSSGKCLYQPMRSLGEVTGKKGDYTLHSDDLNLDLYFEDEKWSFRLLIISEDTLYLEAKHPTDMDYSLVLTPFPEL